MSTPAELGLDTPDLNDLIREGASNITTNAEVLADLWDLLAAVRLTRMPNGSDWRSMPDGFYRIETYGHADGLTPALPADMRGPGVMRITSPSSTVRTYEFISGTDKGVWFNSRNDGVYAGWRKVTTGGLDYQRMPNGSDWRVVPTDGIYRIETYAHADGLTPSLPENLKSAGVLRVHTPLPGGTVRTYEFISGTDKGVWFNTRNDGVYAGWRKVTTGGLDYQRMPNGSTWTDLADGIYRIETLPHAQGLTPSLPAAMASAGVMRITSPSSTVRTYEFISGTGKGVWFNTRNDGTLAEWRPVGTGSDGDYATKEELGRYVLEGDARLYDARRPLDTGWRLIDTTDTTGTVRTAGTLRLRRTGDTVYAQLGSVALSSGSGAGLVFTIPEGFTPAGDIPALTLDSTGTRRPLDITATGIRWPSGARPANPLTGILTWPTDDDTTVFYQES